MFDETHYVPVLRWKAGEKRALRHLLHEDKARMTPLIEWPRAGEISHSGDEKRPTNSTPNDLARDIMTYWGARRFFCDMHRYADTMQQRNPVNLRSYTSALRDRGVRAIPVLTLGDNADYASDMQPLTECYGVCLRVGYGDLVAADFTSRVAAFAAQWSRARLGVHFIADFGVRYNEADISSLTKRIPNLSAFTTFTLVGGAFPLDLTGMKGPATHRLPRAEWLKYVGQVKTVKSRRPTFGDYATLHPHLAPRKPGGLNPTASIRYTVADSWLVFKGEPLHNEDGPGHAQYRGHSLLLTKHKEYAGAQFSFADQLINQVATGSASTGTPTTWVSVGVNHHLTFAVRQIASLF